MQEGIAVAAFAFATRSIKNGDAPNRTFPLASQSFYFCGLFLRLVSQLNLSFPICLFIMLIFCGTDQLPFPQKALVPLLHRYSPRVAHAPQERKETTLQRAAHMLCLTQTSLCMLSPYLPQATHFLQPVFTSSPEEKAGQLLLQPSSPHAASLSVKDEQLASSWQRED